MVACSAADLMYDKVHQPALLVSHPAVCSNIHVGVLRLMITRLAEQ